MEVRSHRIRIALLVVAVISTAALAYSLAVSPPHRINSKSAEKIHQGMARSEVLEILGAEPGDYSNGRCRMTCWVDTEDFPKGAFQEEWRAEHVLVQVHFDAAGRVIIMNVGHSPPSPWYERVWHWIRTLA